MGFLDWLKFKGGRNKPPKAGVVIYSTPIADSTDLGNLIYEKRYEEAIALGQKMLAKNPRDAMVHINLMCAYFKARETNPTYFDLSTEHAKRAILCGHDTGYAHERLAINLEKRKRYHQAMQLYSLILDTPGFRFSMHGCGNAIDWDKRAERTRRRLGEASDSETDILFSESEIAEILTVEKPFP